MFWFGLLIAVCWVPGYTGFLIPTQWAVLSCLLPLALWRGNLPPHWPTLPFWLGAGFLVYAFTAVLWSENVYDAGWGLWLLTITALSFWLGATLPDLRRVYTGLAVGLSMSSILAIAQWFDFRGIPFTGGPAGLYFNPAVHGAVLALVIVALLTERLWYYVPTLIPGLVLSNSRGAWLAVAIGTAVVFCKRPMLICILGLAAVFIATYGGHVSDNDRLFHWKATVAGLSWFGWGPGAFLGVFFQSIRGPEVWYNPAGFAHNDYLQLAFEFGIGSILILSLYAVLLLQTTAREWSVFVTFCILSLFFFPLYLAVPAFIGALSAGRIARDWRLPWYLSDLRRPNLLPWRTPQQRSDDQSWGGNLPTQQGTPLSVSSKG